MVDTQRTVSALQALLADNTAGDISAQDVRDFLVSAVPTGRSHTLVVAANDANAAQKVAADYVCDGTDDEVQIEAAIAALPSTGGVVYLSSGNFSTGTEIDLNVNDVTLLGSGTSTIINVAAGTATDQDTIQIAADRCGVGNLRVIGGAGIGRNAIKVGVGSDDVQLFNLYLDTPNVHGIGATGSSGNVINRLSIRNVYVTGAGAGAVAGQGVVLSEFTADCLVDGLWATGCLESGLHTFDNGGGTLATRHNFSNIFAWSNSVHGISVQDSNRVNVSNFICHSNGTHGIRFNAAASSTVSNGLTYGNGDDGVSSNATSTSLILANIIADGNTDNGFDISSPSTSLTNCQALNHTGTGDRGFSMSSTSNYSQLLNCSADGNYVNIFTSASATGLQIIGGALTNATNNNVTNNSGALIKNVVGYVTENAGTSAVANGTTSTVVTHGLAATPTLDRIVVTLGEQSTTDPGQTWVDTITSTTFTVNTATDPGASGLDFGWRVII